MDIIRLVFLVLLLTTSNLCSLHAQNKKKSSYPEIVYDDHSYRNDVKTAQLYPLEKESGFPIINLNSKDQLLLSFDVLGTRTGDFYISIEHCNADWSPSKLSPLNYAIGYNEDRITDVTPSSNTFQPYIHYQTIFPNDNIKPKISGNYLLKVYEDANKRNLILTKRFYVTNSLGEIIADIIPSPIIDKKEKYQKLNITYKSSITINNPHRDLQIHVLQNQRPDNMQIVRSPTFVGNNQYRYDAINNFNFLANNEFRFVDLRTVNGGSAQVEKIIRDSSITMILFPDQSKEAINYASAFDENGNFYIRNQDYDQAETYSDYINVIFSLQTTSKINGNIYLVGRFNNFNRNATNKLQYNENQKSWSTNQLLKQGLYDYEYVLEDENGKLITDAFSGSHFATGNDYQILIYIRRPGTYWDEIIDYKTVSIHNKHTN